jgi:endonuclease III|tara:strand:+ start:345 stop:752 length:408 start_codon:yes stop_codon:yes gene_type:complete
MRDDLMVQQQVDNVWQHMVGVICLNQTGRKKVKKVLPEFFKKFPTPEQIFESDKDTIAEMLKDLGMKNVRAHRIWRMTEEYLKWDGEDATKLFGIGKYGSDSYEIFYKNRIPNNVQDKELIRYIREEHGSYERET